MLVKGGPSVTTNGNTKMSRNVNALRITDLPVIGDALTYIWRHHNERNGQTVLEPSPWVLPTKFNGIKVKACLSMYTENDGYDYLSVHQPEINHIDKNVQALWHQTIA